MLPLILQIIGIFFLVGGTFFCVLGVYGIIALPDTYNRLHATSKVLTFGAGAVALSLLFLAASPRMGLKGLAVAIFLLLTGPIVTHVLARAAYRVRVPLTPSTVRDDLAEDQAAGRQFS